MSTAWITTNIYFSALTAYFVVSAVSFVSCVKI